MDNVVGLVTVVLSLLCGLVVCIGFMVYLINQQKMRHAERMAMIEKGIYVEAKKQESGVPSLAVIMLVGIGLATLAIREDYFLGYSLLFIGVGLMVRDRLIRHKKVVTGRIQTGRVGSQRLDDTKPTQKGQEPWS